MEQHTALLQRLSGANRLPVDQYLMSAREALLALTSIPDLLNSVRLTRVCGGFTRNLIFGDDQMSVWAIVWAPGARTPIHDHHCSCCFAVLQGVLREVWFDAVGGDHAIETARHHRTAGHIAAMMPSGPNIHQMLNEGPDEAVSIHIYGYDHRLQTSSIDREYRRIEH